MSEILPQLVEAYAGQTAEEIHADMVATGADSMFADPWLVASFIAYQASGG